MKKLVVVLLFTLFISVDNFAQDLTPEYLAQCREFLQFLRDNGRLASETYIWSPNAIDTADIFDGVPVLRAGNRGYYQGGCFSGGRLVADTVKLSEEDVNYSNHIFDKHDTAWRNFLATNTGLLAEEPWVTKNTDRYKAISAPLFYQNQSVCIVFFLSESRSARANGYELYKRDSNEWAYITNIGTSVSCRDEQSNHSLKYKEHFDKTHPQK